MRKRIVREEFGFLDFIGDIFEKVGEFIGDVAEGVVKVAGELLEGIVDFGEEIIEGIGKVAVPVVAVVSNTVLPQPVGIALTTALKTGYSLYKQREARKKLKEILEKIQNQRIDYLAIDFDYPTWYFISLAKPDIVEKWAGRIAEYKHVLEEGVYRVILKDLGRKEIEELKNDIEQIYTRLKEEYENGRVFVFTKDFVEEVKNRYPQDYDLLEKTVIVRGEDDRLISVLVPRYLVKNVSEILDKVLKEELRNASSYITVRIPSKVAELVDKLPYDLRYKLTNGVRVIDDKGNVLIIEIPNTLYDDYKKALDTLGIRFSFDEEEVIKFPVDVLNLIMNKNPSLYYSILSNAELYTENGMVYMKADPDFLSYVLSEIRAYEPVASRLRRLRQLQFIEQVKMEEEKKKQETLGLVLLGVGATMLLTTLTLSEE